MAEAEGNSTGSGINFISLIIILILILLPGILSKCATVSICDKKIKFFRNDIHLFEWMKHGRHFGDSNRRHALNYHLSGTTLADISLQTFFGNIDIPRNSDITVNKARLGPDIVIFMNSQGFHNVLSVFNNEIAQGLRSITMTADGRIMGFTSFDESIPITINNIEMNVLEMRIDYKISDYRDKEYIYFKCNGISPVEFDKDSQIIIDDNMDRYFSVTIEESALGFLTYYTLTSAFGKSFVLKHPSLESETRVAQVKFDVLFNEITAYKIDSKGEETKISYKEKTIETKGKSDMKLFAEMMREALRINKEKENNND